MGTLQVDHGLAYGFAQALVTYVVENYGGLDGLWKYANTYDESTNIDKALKASFGVSYEQFDKDWQAWLKKQC